MQKLSWKSIQEQFPTYAKKYSLEFKQLFTKSGKTELSIEDIDDYLTQETSLTAYKIGGYTRYFNDTAGRVLGRVEVADNGDSQCYDTGGSLLGMVIGGQTFAANGVLLSPQDILATLLVKEDRVQASNKKASQECVGCDRHFNTKLVNNYDKAIYLCPNCIDKEKEIVEKLTQPINNQKNSFKNLVNWFKRASYYSEEKSAKIIGDYIVELAEVYFEEESGRAYSHAEVKLWDKEGKGEFKFKTPTKTKRFDTLQEAEEMYNKINNEEDFNLLDGKQADVAETLFDINTVDEVVSRLQSELQIPFVQPYKSTLGGADRVTIMVKASLDAKDTWAGGYFENSRRLNFSVERDGTIEQFSKSFKIPIKFRKTKVKSIDDLITKLNTYFASVQNTTAKQANREFYDFWTNIDNQDKVIYFSHVDALGDWLVGSQSYKDFKNHTYSILYIDVSKDRANKLAKDLSEITSNGLFWENPDISLKVSNKKQASVSTVRDISESYSFIDDTYEVVELNKDFGTDYDSFFVDVADGEYTNIYGMYGVVPLLDNLVYRVKRQSNKQADEQLINPRMHIPESYSPLYEERTIRPEEWTSYGMEDIYEDDEEQPSKYIPKKKQRGKYNLYEIVMTPEGRGRIVMKQVDYEPYSYTVALTGKDEITIVEEPQIQRLASIGKQAKRNEALFKASVYLDVWVDGDMIEYDDELVKIRKSNDSEDEKIKLAKERVTEIVRDAVYKVQIPDTESEVYINDVQIDKLDRDSKYDNIDYAALFPAVYEIPKEIDFRGYTGESKQFTEDSIEYQIIDKLTDEEYESYDKQLRESGVDLSFKGEGMLLKKKGSKKSANAKELWEMTKEEFKQYLDIHLVPENWMEVMRDILSKIPYNTSIYITDLIKSPGKAYLAHPFIIQQALSEGKLIPAKVLADYPDLRKKSSNKQAKSLVDMQHETEDIINASEFKKYVENVYVLDPSNKGYPSLFIRTNTEPSLFIKELQKLIPQYYLKPMKPYLISVNERSEKSSIKQAKSVGWLRDKFLNKIDKIADVAAEVNDEFKKEREDGEGRGISLIDYYTTGRYHEIEKPLSADAITKSQAEKLMEDLVYQFKTELFAIYNISSGAADKIVDEPKGVSMKDIEELEEATDKESAIEKEIEFYPMDSISTGYPSSQYLQDIVEPVKQPEGKYLSY